MSVTLEPIAPRLAKLVPLLSSDQPGEVVAAAAAIGRALESIGATWHDLAARITVGATPPAPPPTSQRPDLAFKRMAETLLRRPDLSRRRREFLLGMLDCFERRGWFTPRQRTSIADTWRWTVGEVR